MSDQPISNEELTMLEAATKAAMQYQDRLAVVVDTDIMRRLIAEVRALRESSSTIFSDKQAEEFLVKFNAGLAAETRRIARRSKYITDKST